MTPQQLKALGVFARYTNTYDVVNGVLVTKWNDYWPAVTVPDQDPKPVIYKWSDITYYEWVKQRNIQFPPNTDPKEINFIVITGLQFQPESQDNGRETNIAVEVIFDVMTMFHKPGLPSWQDRFRVMQRENGPLFDALIGIEPGQMVTDFLSQHKHMLGNRWVQSVTAWSDQPQEHVRNNRFGVKINLIYEVTGAPGHWDPDAPRIVQDTPVVPLNSYDGDFGTRPGSPGLGAGGAANHA